MKESKVININYYSKTLSGHRASYLAFVQSKFGGQRAKASSLFFCKEPVFFLMIEDNFILYFIVSLWRSILKRRTVGLLFRPKPAIEASNWKLKLKRSLLKFLCKCRWVYTFSIVPEPLMPSIAEIIDDWIYDFQLWDLTQQQKQDVQLLRQQYKQNLNIEDSKYKIINEIREFSQGRQIVTALGVQNKGKGIDILAASMDGFKKQNWGVIVAGRFSNDSDQAKEQLKANYALILDRFMTDDEILALYAVADAAWCLYDPSYDQASGILGRAIQLNVLPIVRKNSLSNALCIKESIRHIAADDSNDVEDQLKTIIKRNDVEINLGDLDFEKLSLSKLTNALGLMES